MTGLYICLAIGAVILTLVGIIVIRTLMFSAKAAVKTEAEDVYVNVDKAVFDLSEMIKCKTVSYKEKELEDETQFNNFKALLPKLFPNIFNSCEYTQIGSRAILFKYSGKKHDAPTVLMSHYDVVSVEEDQCNILNLKEGSCQCLMKCLMNAKVHIVNEWIVCREIVD